MFIIMESRHPNGKGNGPGKGPMSIKGRNAYTPAVTPKNVLPEVKLKNEMDQGTSADYLHRMNEGP